MAKKKVKQKWVQDGESITLTVKVPHKRRRPVMLYSIEFNFGLNSIDDKKKVRYNRKQKHRNKDD